MSDELTDDQQQQQAMDAFGQLSPEQQAAYIRAGAIAMRKVERKRRSDAFLAKLKAEREACHTQEKVDAVKYSNGLRPFTVDGMIIWAINQKRADDKYDKFIASCLITET